MQFNKLFGALNCDISCLSVFINIDVIYTGNYNFLNVFYYLGAVSVRVVFFCKRGLPQKLFCAIDIFVLLGMRVEPLAEWVKLDM